MTKRIKDARFIPREQFSAPLTGQNVSDIDTRVGEQRKMLEAE